MRPLAPQLSHFEPNMTPTGTPELQKSNKNNGFSACFIFLLVCSSYLFGLPWAPLGLILGHLGPILTHLGLILGSSWPLLAPSCSSMAPLVPICLQFGCSRVPFGSLLAPFWILLDQLGVILGSFWHQVGTMWSSCCGDFLTLFLNNFKIF